MIELDTENDGHMSVMSMVFHMPISTVKKNLQVVQSVIKAHEHVTEEALEKEG